MVGKDDKLNNYRVTFVKDKQVVETIQLVLAPTVEEAVALAYKISGLLVETPYYSADLVTNEIEINLL